MKNLIYLLLVVFCTSCAQVPIMKTKSYGTNCETTQCGGMTKSKTRCKNKTTNCSGRCYQH